MNILALDTSGDTLHIALQTPNTFISTTRKIGRRFSEELVPRLRMICEDAGITLSELTLIVCTNGPGSFTGLRVGMSAAKGISLAGNIPLVSLSTMDIFSFPLMHAALPVLIILDAKKQRFYCALYRDGERLTSDRDASVDEILEMVAPYGEVLLSGPDAMVFMRVSGDEVTHEGKVIKFHIDSLKMRDYGESMILIGKKLFESEGPDDIASGPTYIRKSDAEVSLEKRNAHITPKEVLS